MRLISWTQPRGSKTIGLLVILGVMVIIRWLVITGVLVVSRLLITTRRLVLMCRLVSKVHPGRSDHSSLDQCAPQTKTALVIKRNSL